VSNQDPSSTPNERKASYRSKTCAPISDRAMAIFSFAILVAIVVLGYLLMTKLADDSRAENCMMAHRKKLRRNRMALTRAALRGHRLTVRVMAQMRSANCIKRCPPLRGNPEDICSN